MADYKYSLLSGAGFARFPSVLTRRNTRIFFKRKVKVRDAVKSGLYGDRRNIKTAGLQKKFSFFNSASVDVVKKTDSGEFWKSLGKCILAGICGACEFIERNIFVIITADLMTGLIL